LVAFALFVHFCGFRTESFRLRPGNRFSGHSRSAFICAHQRFFSSLCFFLLLSSSLHAATPAEFPIRRALLPAAVAPAGLTIAELDEPVFAATDNAYANLRLFRHDDLETPFVVVPLRRERTFESEFDVPFIQDAVRITPDNRIEIDLRLHSAGERPIALTVDTPLDNFEKHLTVWTSPDGATWQPLVQTQPIFDYARFMPVRNVRINLPPSPHRHYRVEIADISEDQQSPWIQFERERQAGALVNEVEHSQFQRRDFRIDRLHLRGIRSTTLKDEVVTRPYAVTDFRAEHLSDRRQTLIHFSTARVPLTELTILTDAPFFSRTVALQGADNPDATWQPILNTTISRLTMAGFKQDQTRLTVPGAPRFQHYRLLIEDLDSPPLTIRGVTVAGQSHEIVFYADAHSSYTLHAGATAMPAPRYDVAPTLATARTIDATVLTLGPEDRNPAYREHAHAGGAHRWWNSRTFLIAAVLLVVAALAWTLAKAARQVGP
jgi:hypothetical protein